MGKKLNLINIGDLLDRQFEANLPLIENLLYRGTYLLVGPPKIGKSFFMIQLAYHVASGINLWNFPTRQSKVLYLALEDHLARIQKRYSTMFGFETDLITTNLIISDEAKLLGEGLVEDIENFILENNNVGLIIIDTLQMIRNPSLSITSYNTDYETLASIKSISDKYNVTILIVHHTRKMDSNDAFETISGTNGLLGAADGAFVIQKNKRIENKAIINIVGREQPDLQIDVEFDRVKHIWELKKEIDLNQNNTDPILAKINEFLDDKWQGTATQLLKEFQIEGLMPHILTRKLNSDVSKLLALYKIKYLSKRTSNERVIFLERINSDGCDAYDACKYDCNCDTNK